MIVYDCQAHWYPPGFFELCLGRTTFPRCRRGGDGYLFELGPESFVPFSGPMIDLGRLLGLMERNGIDVLVSSCEPLSVTGWQIDEAAEAARVLNEEKARAQQQHPDRYIGLATLPLQDVERALEELEHAVVGLGLRGVCFPSNIQGSPITSPELMPLYERIEELGVPLFLHPTASIARERLRDYGLDYVIGYMLDTSVAALNLVFSGTTRRCPGLKIVHPHLGAVLPYLAGRIDFEYKTPVGRQRGTAGAAERVPARVLDGLGLGDPGIVAHGTRLLRPRPRPLRDRLPVVEAGAGGRVHWLGARRGRAPARHEHECEGAVRALKEESRMPTLIDLTTPLENRALSEPTFAPEFESAPRIEYFSHARGAEECESLFGCSRDELPNGLGWSVEVVHAIVHTATHCDSPWHYSPVTDGGKTRSMTIDEVPLDWYYGPGVILDMTHKGPEEPIEPDDVQQALDKIDYEVEQNDIVLFRTDGYKLWGKQAYLTHFPGMTKAGAEYLVDRGVRVMGVDAYNFDMPFATQKRPYEETGDASVIEPCHMALGFERNYAHIEKLANLDKVPRPYGFTFSALPIKIKGASGAWCRAVAILDDDE